MKRSTTSSSTAVRSIPQVEANEFFREFFKKRQNQPAKYADLVIALHETLQANDNQASGLIYRASANAKVLVKEGKQYKLNEFKKESSMVKHVKSKIKSFKTELEQEISIKNIPSASEFELIKDILNQLEKLSN